MGDVSLGSSKISSDVDCTINSWCVDYYTFTAINAFRNGDYADFCNIRDVLQSLVARPLEHSKIIKKQIRVLQFLSRINDGDKLDLNYESQDTCSPLKSAVSLLLSFSEELEVPQTVMDTIQKSIYETLVILYIRNKNFLKAEEIVTRHLPDSMAQEKENLLQLVHSRSDPHPVLQRFSYESFRKSMLDFCESLFSSPEPLLYKIAKELAASKQLDESKTNKNQPTMSPAQADMGPIGSPALVQLKQAVLKAAFESLREEHQVRASFQQLEYEVRQELQWQDAEGGVEGPVGGASTARPCTVARLVMEEDSEVDSVVSQGEPAAPPPNLRAPSQEPAAQPEEPCDALAELAARPEQAQASPIQPVAQPREPQVAAPEKAWSSEESPLSAVSSPVLPYRRPRPRTSRCVRPSDDSDSSGTPEDLPAADPPQTAVSDGTLRPKRRMLDSVSESKEGWSDEDSLFPRNRGTSRTEKSRKARRTRQFWTAQESEWVREGVAQYGEGNWVKIRDGFPFQGRTSVNIKDKWRTMKKMLSS